MANTGPYPLLSISATTSLTKGQPWRPERSTYVEPLPLTEPPPLTDKSPQVSELAVQYSSSPTGNPPDPQTIPEAHDLSPSRAAAPPTSDTTLPEVYPHVAASRSGHKSPTPTNLNLGPDPATMPAPLAENSPNRVHIGGPLLSRGAFRVRLAWARRLETKRRRINTANKHYILVDHWPTLRPPSLPITTQIRHSTPPSRVVFFLSDGDLIRIIRSYTIHRCGPNTLSSTHPLTLPWECQTRL
jgi:hypothetical protein